MGQKIRDQLMADDYLLIQCHTKCSHLFIYLFIKPSEMEKYIYNGTGSKETIQTVE